MPGALPWILLACFGGIVLVAVACWWAYRRLHDEYNDGV
jgi:hypothetical protein